MLSRWPGWLAALLVTLLAGALVLLDVTDHGLRRWWAGHAMTTDTVSGLLVLLITVLVIDQVVRLRQIKNRARAVAAQAAIIASQATRTSRAVSEALAGSGDREAASDEFRTYIGPPARRGGCGHGGCGHGNRGHEVRRGGPPGSVRDGGRVPVRPDRYRGGRRLRHHDRPDLARRRRPAASRSERGQAHVLETLLAEHSLAEHSLADGVGLSACDQSLAEEMIEDSDNDAATSPWYEAGGAAGIRSFNADAGLIHTAPSSCVVCAGFSWPGWGLTTTTPDDQITLLRQLIMPGSLLTSTDRSYALSLMEDVTPSQRWGISGGVPAQVTVALKNGWLPLQGTDGDWQINSVGWVSGSGRGYLMAVLTTGNPTEQYGIGTIGQLAAMTWQALG